MKNKESLVHTSLFLTTRFNHACAQDVGWGGCLSRLFDRPRWWCVI